MDYTQNYQLPQWVETDRIMMDDFNDMTQKLDAALHSLAGQLSQRGNCGMEILTYTGTGVFGPDHPSTLTFSAVPAAFFIVGPTSVTFGLGGAATALTYLSGATTSISYTTMDTLWSGTQLTYFDYNEKQQQNVAGQSYWVLALSFTDQ